MFQAFKLRLQIGISGQPRGGAYYGVNNATDDKSIGTITELLNNMQIANNTPARTINEHMSAMSRETQELHSIITHLHQQ